MVALVFATLAFKKVNRLEREWQTREGLASRNEQASETTPLVSSPVFAAARLTEGATPSRVSSSQSMVPASPSLLGQAGNWFLHDWPVKLGAILFFLAIGWIVPYFAWQFIGPAGRVMLGVVLGVAFLVFGTTRIRQFRNQGSVFLALGGGIVSLALATGQFQYELLPPAVVLGCLFITTVFLSWVSVVERARAVAFLALFLGALAPLLTNAPSTDFAALFSFLFLLCLGVLWVIRLTGWRILMPLAIGIYGIYSLPYLASFSSGPDATQALFAMLFALLFFIFNIVSIVSDRKAEPSDLAVPLLNALILLGWIHQSIVPEARSFVAVIAAVSASIGAHMVYSATRLTSPVLIHSASSLLLLALAAVYAFDGPALHIALTLEAALLVLGLLWFLKNLELARKASWFLVIPFVLVFFGNVGHYARGVDVFTGDFWAICVLILTLGAVGSGFLREGYASLLPQHQGSSAVSAGMIWSGLSAFLAMLLLWMMLHIALSENVATLICLTVYTLIGLYLYLHGRLQARKNESRVGAILLIFVTAHLLLVEIGSLDVEGRIVVFTVIGLLLMSTAFFGRKQEKETTDTNVNG